MSFTTEFSIGDTYFVSSFEEFKDVLREHEMDTGTKYVYGKGNKLFTKTDVKLTTDLRLHWLDDTPFFHFGRRVYTCHQGKDKNLSQKQKYHKLRDEKALYDNVPVKRYNKKKLTKKLECPARVSIIRIYRMPEYRVTSVRIKEKLRISSMIKSRIRDDEHVVGEEGYLFNIPRVQDHQNHSIKEKPISHFPIEHIEAAANEHLGATANVYLEYDEELETRHIKTEVCGENEHIIIDENENLTTAYVVEFAEGEASEHYETVYAIAEFPEPGVNEHLEAAYTVAEMKNPDTNEHLEAAYAVAELTESCADAHLQAAVAVAELTESVSSEHLEAAVAVAELTESVTGSAQMPATCSELTSVADTEQTSVVTTDEKVSGTDTEQVVHFKTLGTGTPRRKGQTLIQRNKKRKLINDCKATMQSIQSVIWHLEEKQLTELSSSLNSTLEIVSTQVSEVMQMEQMSMLS